MLLGTVLTGRKTVTLTSYADDVKVPCAVKDCADTNLLQESLDAIYQWAKESRTTCNLIQQNSSTASLLQQSSIGPGGVTVQELNVVCDLGIKMSSDVTLHAHIAEQGTR